MTPLLEVITFSGLFIYLTFGLFNYTEAVHLRKGERKHSPNAHIARKPYGCSKKFFESHCYKHCPKSKYWCYTEANITCHNDRDCKRDLPCAGWCAWNSPKGCVSYCEGEQLEFHCDEENKFWQCQLDHGYGYQSAMAIEGQWVSPDIDNHGILDKSGNEIILHSDTVRSIRYDPFIPQTAVWVPTGPIQNSTSEFFWTFFIQEKPSPSSRIYVGVSDLTTIEGGRDGLLGLFYGGPLYNGDDFIDEEYGRKLEVGDLILMHVKFRKGKMTVYFGLNYDPIYKAFEWPIASFDGHYPAVLIHGRGVVEVNEKTRDVLKGRKVAAEIKEEIHEVLKPRN